MHRAPPRALRDLLTARYARRGDDRVGRRGTDGRKEPHAADLERQVVVLALEAERPGHAAAAGVHHLDHRTRHVPQQRDAAGDRTSRLLMAVTMKQDTYACELRVRLRPERSVIEGLREQVVDHPRLSADGRRVL